MAFLAEEYKEQRTNASEEELSLRLNRFMFRAFNLGLPPLREALRGRVIVQRRPMSLLGIEANFRGRLDGWVIMRQDLEEPDTEADIPYVHRDAAYILNANGNVGWALEESDGAFHEMEGDRRFRSMNPYRMALEPTLEDLAAVEDGRLRATNIFLGYATLLGDLKLDPNVYATD